MWNGIYMTKVYSNAMDLASGQDIVLSWMQHVEGIDVSLDVGARVSGIVTGPGGTPPLQDAYVATYYSSDGSNWQWQPNGAWTASDGSYTVSGLAAGTYRFRFEDAYLGYHIPEFFSNANSVATGDDVVVAAGTHVTGIDASLTLGGKISGMVTADDRVTPLSGIQATAYTPGTPSWNWIDANTTAGDGTYNIGPVSSGAYRVSFDDYNNRDSIGQYYSNAYDQAASADVIVSPGQTTTGIDASLLPISVATPRTVGIQLSGSDTFLVEYVGFSNMTYNLQESPSPTGVWQDVGSYYGYTGGTGTITRTPSNTPAFWRILLSYP
jgi:hypothetical protein